MNRAERCVNPPASSLGQSNAVLAGSSRTYHVADFEGSLSIKTVVQGVAVWRIKRRRYVMRENTWLILNDRQLYSLDIESREKTTTFCIFFQRGFVEDIWRARVTSPDQLLEAPEIDLQRNNMGFFERLNNGDDVMSAEIDEFRTALLSGSTTAAEKTDRFIRLGSRLVSSEEHILRDVAKLPAVRPSTKREICRRVLRGRDLLLSTFDQRLTLKQIASEACMSPYHFHRSFRQLFGMTPHALLTAYRLQRAATRLKTTSDNVTEISYESGFESLPSFSALFRRHFGKSPSRFRRF